MKKTTHSKTQSDTFLLSSIPFLILPFLKKYLLMILALIFMLIFVFSYFHEWNSRGGGIWAHYRAFEETKGWLITAFIFTTLAILASKPKMITLVNKDGLLKKCPIGFSFPTLLFAPLSPLARGDLKWASIFCIFTWVFVGIIPCIFTLIINFLIAIIFAFKYNKLYILDNLEKGYLPYDNETQKELNNMKIYYAKR